MMQAFGTSVSKTYNKKISNRRFIIQGPFRDEHVGEAGDVMRVTRYLHYNPVKARLCCKPENWPYSNYCDVIGKRNGMLCDFSPALKLFANDAGIYQKFVLDPLVDNWGAKVDAQNPRAGGSCG